jgi:hypothetical protein
VSFDALSNRVIYSRQDLQRFWMKTVEQLREMRWWNIRPWRLAKTLAKDFALTTSFALSLRASSRPH